VRANSPFRNFPLSFGISSRHLSQLLNERLGMSFFDYVNRLRVDEVKRLLSEPKLADRSILDLAFEAGFSSKSSFNSIFKRFTGQSPTAYRRQSPSSSTSQQSGTSRPMGQDDGVGSSIKTLLAFNKQKI
jgi:AraC-like DNA-binding protein